MRERSASRRVTYSEKLRDPRWQKKRLEIMDLADFKCEGCGRGDIELHVHHGYYVRQYEPWEHPNETLWCLCRDCHYEAEGFRQDAYMELALINPMRVGPHKILRDAFDRNESARKGDSVRGSARFPEDDPYEAQIVAARRGSE